MRSDGCGAAPSSNSADWQGSARAACLSRRLVTAISPLPSADLRLHDDEYGDDFDARSKSGSVPRQLLHYTTHLTGKRGMQAKARQAGLTARV
jgi:hypothetical protein